MLLFRCLSYCFDACRICFVVFRCNSYVNGFSRVAPRGAASRRLVGRQSIFGLKPLERLDAVSGAWGVYISYIYIPHVPALALIKKAADIENKIM